MLTVTKDESPVEGVVLLWALPSRVARVAVLPVPGNPTTGTTDLLSVFRYTTELLLSSRS